MKAIKKELNIKLERKIRYQVGDQLWDQPLRKAGSIENKVMLQVSRQLRRPIEDMLIDETN